MTGGANSKFLSRMMILGFVALAFAGCAAMLSQSDSGLFADASYTHPAR